MPEKTKKDETTPEEIVEEKGKTITIKHEFILPKKDEKTKTKTPPVKTPTKVPATPPTTPPATPPVTPPTTPPVTPPTTPVTPEEKVATLETEKKALEEKITALEGSAEKTKDIQTELEKTKKDLKERTDILALIALKEFEAEKKTLIDVAKKDWEAKGLEKEEIDKKVKYIDDTIDDTEKLKQVMKLMPIFQAPADTSGGEEVVETPTTPAGKATMPTVPKQYEGMKNVIDELYNILADPTKTQIEKDEADRRIDSMFMEFLKGVRVSQQKGTFPTFRKTTCPQCGELIEGANATGCDHCGWKQVVPRRIRTR